MYSHDRRDETAPPLLRVLYNGEGGGVYSSTKVAEAHRAFSEIARWTLDEFGEVVARVVPANHAAECTKVESPEFAQKLLRAAQAQSADIAAGTPAAEAWNAALAGSRLAEVALPHKMCSSEWPPVSIMPVLLAARAEGAAARRSARDLASVDASTCACVCSSRCGLGALSQLRALEVLRLPKERWRENELATCLTKLNCLRCIDSDSLADLRSEREALRMQCDILNRAQDGLRRQGKAPAQP